MIGQILPPGVASSGKIFQFAGLFFLYQVIEGL